MNFLAHLYLAERQPDALLGSLMGDFVKGPLEGRFSPELTRALAQHRKVDAFTDAHPIVRASRGRVAPARRRFAGILVDVFYDHFLALHWEDYADEPLEAFTREVYSLLRTREAILPERLRLIAPLMAQLDWLGSYRRVEAVHVALDRMGERLKRGNALLGAGEELTANYAGLQADFRAFFPEVVRFAEDLGSREKARLRRTTPPSP
jgi:acyl carrier protein phosphodiesterase